MMKIKLVSIAVIVLSIQGCSLAPTASVYNDELLVKKEDVSITFAAPENMDWISGLSNNLMRKVHRRNSKWLSGGFVEDAVFFDKNASDFQHGLYDRASAIDKYINENGIFILSSYGKKNAVDWSRQKKLLTGDSELHVVGKNHEIFTDLVERKTSDDEEYVRVLSSSLFTKNGMRFQLMGYMKYSSPEDKIFIEEKVVEAMNLWGVN